MRSFLILLFLLWPAVSQAAVRISFNSRDFGEYYPHALIVLTGTLDETGEKVEANFGWTSTAPDVIIALGRRVPGVVSSSTPKYLSKTAEDFAFILSDDEYRAVMARVQYWRDLPQPSYSLNEVNCVYFVADIARTLGLDADPKAGLMRKPKAFLRAVENANRSVIAGRALPRPALASPTPTALPSPADGPDLVPASPALALH